MTAYGRTNPPRTGPCPAVLSYAKVTVRLPHALGKRAIYDGSATPATRLVTAPKR